MIQSIPKFACVLFMGLTFLAPCASWGQGVTTAAASGFVTAKDVAPTGTAGGSRPVPLAQITFVHEPTGTTWGTLTWADFGSGRFGLGRFQLSGLRVGGPYTVTFSAAGSQTQTLRDVYLDVGTVAQFSVVLEPAIQSLAPVVVEASRDLTFGAGRIGPGALFDAGQIAAVPSVRRNVQDIAQLDPRVVVMSLDQGGTLSASGQHARFNSFLIDGVQANDPFGLNTNGFSSLRSPVPFESLEALSVELSPYDVRRSGFTGTLLNAVTKSGGNVFHGSAGFEYTSRKWRARNPVNGAREPFRELTTVYTLSGPVRQDRLFFFFNYEEFKRTAAPPSPNVTFTDPTAVNRIIARAAALGYDAGTLDGGPSVATQRTALAKLDWNATDRQRVSLTYRRNHGADPSFTGVTGATSTSLSRYWTDQPRQTDSYTAQLLSGWSAAFRTELNLSYTGYDGTFVNRGTPFPDVTVNGLTAVRADTGATITNAGLKFGTDVSRQLASLETSNRLGSLLAEFSVRAHTLSAGVELDSTRYDNRFVQGPFGLYVFANVAAWEAGTPQVYASAAPFSGFTYDDANGTWEYRNLALFVQDTWRPSPRLTVVGGVRLDTVDVPEKPTANPGFRTAFGIANDTTNDGNRTVSPRLGATYEFPTARRTQARAGLGLFLGRSPAVWLTNAFQNNGTVGAIIQNNPAVTFQPDVTRQPVPPGSPPAPSINVTDPGFAEPSLWKGTLALDHTLPGGDWIASVEYGHHEVRRGVNYQFLNYLRPASGPQTMPDGRERYAGSITPGLPGTPLTNTAGRRRVAGFADVFQLTNTDRGRGDEFTASLSRPLKGRWGASIAWTHLYATEVSPVTSFTASSNYAFRAAFNPNEDVAATTNNAIRDRFVATLTGRAELFRGFPTTATFIYQGRTGHPFSWVFRGDANGDGFTSNDLLYVPTGPSDPSVTWANAAERDAFFAFVEATTLRNFRGGHPGRNSEEAPWTQTIDFKLIQEVPLGRGGRLKGEAFVNILNLANLFDAKWGILEEVPTPYRRAVAGATYDPAGNGGLGAWAYTFNANTLDGVPKVANDHPVSRWQVQSGLRVRF